MKNECFDFGLFNFLYLLIYQLNFGALIQIWLKSFGNQVVFEEIHIITIYYYLASEFVHSGSLLLNHIIFDVSHQFIVQLPNVAADIFYDCSSSCSTVVNGQIHRHHIVSGTSNEIWLIQYIWTLWCPTRWIFRFWRWSWNRFRWQHSFNILPFGWIFHNINIWLLVQINIFGCCQFWICSFTYGRWMHWSNLKIKIEKLNLIFFC